MDALFRAESELVVFLQTAFSSNAGIEGGIRFFAVAAIFIIAAFSIIGLFRGWKCIRISGILFFIESMCAAALSFGVNQALALVYFRQRPFVAFPEKITALIDVNPLSKSFPSDHAAIAFSLATIIYLWSPKYGVWFIVLAILIGIARVAVGVHYPLDIIAGFIIAGAVSYSMHKLFI